MVAPNAVSPSMKNWTLLIVGCGDVGLRVVKLLRGRVRILVLTSSQHRCATLREQGVVPLQGNLDDPQSLARLAGIADAVLHLAPPPAQGQRDPRTRALLSALARRSGRLQRFVYASTTGVYGNCAGALIDETRAASPATDRAHRRVDAELQVRQFGLTCGLPAIILRIPGIYAANREGGQPRDRIVRGTPVLTPEDDVYTNHIHADDLARACVAALFRGLAQRVVHVSDNTDMTMGNYFDWVADIYGLPRPPRITREQAMCQLSPTLLSFMSESRRLKNDRLKCELRVVLRYPTVREGLRS
jgi:nucleoside-diphosphate-sugar epimerase